jgi:hypothetical protein
MMMVIEEEFILINSTGVSHTGCLIASFYGTLMPDQVYSSSALVKLVKDEAPPLLHIDPSTVILSVLLVPVTHVVEAAEILLLRYVRLQFFCKFGLCHHVL